MAFEGTFGTRGPFGARGLDVEAWEAIEGDFWGVWACETTLLTASGAALGKGGGNGDIEMLVTEAEWAW